MAYLDMEDLSITESGSGRSWVVCDADGEHVVEIWKTLAETEEKANQILTFAVAMANKAFDRGATTGARQLQDTVLRALGVVEGFTLVQRALEESLQSTVRLNERVTKLEEKR